MAVWCGRERGGHEWAGGTVCFDAKRDVNATVGPRPGCLALFDDQRLHASRRPIRICYAPRYTLDIENGTGLGPLLIATGNRTNAENTAAKDGAQGIDADGMVLPCRAVVRHSGDRR